MLDSVVNEDFPKLLSGVVRVFDVFGYHFSQAVYRVYEQYVKRIHKHDVMHKQTQQTRRDNQCRNMFWRFDLSVV